MLFLLLCNKNTEKEKCLDSLKKEKLLEENFIELEAGKVAFEKGFFASFENTHIKTVIIFNAEFLTNVWLRIILKYADRYEGISIILISNCILSHEIFIRSKRIYMNQEHIRFAGSEYMNQIMLKKDVDKFTQYAFQLKDNSVIFSEFISIGASLEDMMKRNMNSAVPLYKLWDKWHELMVMENEKLMPTNHLLKTYAGFFKKIVTGKL